MYLDYFVSDLPGRSPAHKWVLLRMFQGLDGQIDIEGGPVEMVRARQLDGGQLPDGGVLKPGKLAEGNEELPASDEEPEAL